jgi:predicted XRE-type DNA-binding protein
MKDNSWLLALVQKSVSEQFRSHMRDARIHQRDIATLLGVSLASISNRFTGRVQWQLDEIYLVGMLLGIDPRSALPKTSDLPKT